MIETMEAPTGAEVEAEVEAESIADGQAPAPVPEPEVKVEPFDVVKAAERWIEKTIERAENEEDEVTAKVIRQRSVVARLAIAIARVKAAEKQLKEKLEDSVDLLDTMEQDAQREIDAKRDQPELPFGEKAAEPDDAWKSLALADIGIPDKYRSKLEEAGVTTFGALEDWRASRYETPKVKGLGEAARQAIDDAVVKWWADLEATKGLSDLTKPGGGMASVTIESGGQSVTLTKESAKRIDGMLASKPGAKVERAVAAMTVATLADLGDGITEDFIRDRYVPSLLTKLQVNRTAALPGVLDLPGHKGQPAGRYVAVPPGGGEPGDYKLLKLIELADGDAIDDSAGTIPDDPFCGYCVTCGSTRYVIGPRAQQVHVKV